MIPAGQLRVEAGPATSHVEASKAAAALPGTDLAVPQQSLATASPRTAFVDTWQQLLDVVRAAVEPTRLDLNGQTVQVTPSSHSVRS